MVSLQYPWDLENVSNIRVTNLQSRGVLDIIPITDFRKYKTLRLLNSSVDFKFSRHPRVLYDTLCKFWQRYGDSQRKQASQIVYSTQKCG